MNDAGVRVWSACAGGCGEPMAFGEGMCDECARLAEHFDARELMVRVERAHVLHPVTPKESAHLGAVEQAPRRGLFTFLGWKVAAPVAAAVSQERLDAETCAAPVAADRERRSGLLAELPRVQCGVRQMCALPRMELLSNEVPVCVVGVVLVWDVLRWLGCAALDALGCFCRKREWRGRLALTGMVIGCALGLAVSCAAWALR